jgi:transposase
MLSIALRNDGCKTSHIALSVCNKPVYKMPDYEYVAKEMMKDGVTLNLLWIEYCEKCHSSGETPYQSTQFNKYYNAYIIKNNATMHLNHKPGEIMQVDWAGNTATIVDTDTGEAIPAYVFVATLPFSGEHAQFVRLKCTI